MRKTLSVLLFLLILIAAVIPAAYANEDDSSKDKWTYHNIFNAVYTYDNLPTLKIEAYFDDNQELIDAIKGRYEFLMSNFPLELAQKLKERNVIVIIVPDCKDYFSGKAPDFTSGFYYPTNKRIFISAGDGNHALASLDGVLYHELGHAVDHAFGQASNTREFRNYYEDEAKNLWTGKPSSPGEMFAILFNIYVWSGKDEYQSQYGNVVFTKLCRKSGEFLMDTLNLDNLWESNDMPDANGLILGLTEHYKVKISSIISSIGEISLRPR